MLFLDIILVQSFESNQEYKSVQTICRHVNGKNTYRAFKTRLKLHKGGYKFAREQTHQRQNEPDEMCIIVKCIRFIRL
jgi:hypothetical protein